MSEPGKSPNERVVVKHASVNPEATVPGTLPVERDLLIAAYIDQITPSNFTGEAKSTLLFETKQYAQDVCSLTSIRRRADRNAERVLRRHVLESVDFLRNKENSLRGFVADWCKWIGFAFLGFAVQQWINIKHEKHITSGSVGLFALDLIITAGLIVSGFLLDRPGMTKISHTWNLISRLRNK